MWFFKKKQSPKPEIKANSVTIEGGQAVIDVRGQTCPGYLLAINKAVDPLVPGTEAKLLITYPPCGDDVGSWCREKDISFLGMTQQDGLWTITIRK